MLRINEIREKYLRESGSQAYIKVSSFLASKGYTICSVTPYTHTNNWYAILIKNNEFIQADVFTNGVDVERIEASVMS